MRLIERKSRCHFITAVALQRLDRNKGEILPLMLVDPVGNRSTPNSNGRKSLYGSGQIDRHVGRQAGRYAPTFPAWGHITVVFFLWVVFCRCIMGERTQEVIGDVIPTDAGRQIWKELVLIVSTKIDCLLCFMNGRSDRINNEYSRNGIYLGVVRIAEMLSDRALCRRSYRFLLWLMTTVWLRACCGISSLLLKAFNCYWW